MAAVSNTLICLKKHLFLLMIEKNTQNYNNSILVTSAQICYFFEFMFTSKDAGSGYVDAQNMP